MNFKNLARMPEGKSIDWREVQWQDMEDEHFIVWMRVASSNNFNKLWGRIEQDLTPGSYYIEVRNLYDVSQFEGEKSVLLTTINSLGGNNYYMALAYIIVGSCTTLLGLASMGIQFRKDQRGDEGFS